MRWAGVLLSLFLASCSFIENANEFKGRGRIDLLFPFDLIPGLKSVLPHIVLDISGGFEWHNDEVQHRHEMELLRAKAELAERIKETENDETVDLEEVFLRALRGDVDPSKLRDR